MGTKTFAVFQTDLKFVLGNRDDLDSYVDDWVNAAYLTLTTKRSYKGQLIRFPELEIKYEVNISDGTKTIPISGLTRPLHIISVWDGTSDKKLDNISFIEFLDTTGREDANAEGAPTQWTRSGSSIHLLPVSDGSYAMDVYYRQKPALLTGTNTTAIGDEWDEPISLLAATQSFMRMGEFDKAKVFRTEFDEIMDDLVGVYDIEQLDRESMRFPDASWLNNEY